MLAVWQLRWEGVAGRAVAKKGELGMGAVLFAAPDEQVVHGLTGAEDNDGAKAQLQLHQGAVLPLPFVILKPGLFGWVLMEVSDEW